MRTWPLAHAMTIRLLPVNSSAPATTTSSSPSENTIPPTSRCAANPRLASLATRVNISAPSPMKAPAITPSSADVDHGKRVFCTPTVRTRSAIWAGV